MNGDIRPFTAPLGGHFKTEVYQVDGTTPTYGYGEWVAIEAPGVINSIGAAAAGETFVAGTHYIAASPFVNSTTDAQLRLDRVGDARYVDGPNTAVLDTVYVPDESTEFVTQYIFNGDDNLVVPTSTEIGLEVGIHNAIAGDNIDRHGIDLGDTGLTITRVLDAQGVDIAVSGNAGVWAVFRKTAVS
jgi:hypothetical protein